MIFAFHQELRLEKNFNKIQLSEFKPFLVSGSEH